MDQQKTNQWINVLLALLLLVGIALTVYAINQVRSISPEAKGKPTTSSASSCKTSTGTLRNQSVGVGETKTHSVNLCSGTSFVAWIIWGKKIDSEKDLALRVTNPAGSQYSQDSQNTAVEVLTVYASSKEGTWKVEVTNNGSKNVKYDFSAGVGTN